MDSHRRLFDRLHDPIRAIREGGGLGKFLGDEFFGLRAFPNYTLHLLGGGYDFRALGEWFAAREVAAPYLWGALVTFLANVSNEAVETTAPAVGVHDHLADLFFFDIAGKILFYHDPVAAFFHDTLGMRSWHYQPMFNVRTGRIENAGANYIFRPAVLGETWRPFFHLGMQILLGVSRRVTPADSLSAGLGVALTDPLKTRGYFAAGLYWDRNDALLASLILNGTSDLLARLNVYPGVWRLWDLRVGSYVSVARGGTVTVGFTVNLPMGAAVSF